MKPRGKYKRTSRTMYTVKDIIGPESVDIVRVEDLPLTRRESAYDEIVKFVWTLAKGQGVRLKGRAPKPDAEAKGCAIRAWANKIGKPVTTQVRNVGSKEKNPTGKDCGYQIWIFKQTDLLTKRKGHAVRR